MGTKIAMAYHVRLTEAAFSADIENISDPEEVVIPESSVRVKFSYPFRTNHVFELTAPNARTEFTRLGLALVIADQYQAMYEEERRGSVDRAASQGNASTDGIYGIHSHMLGDLLLLGVTYDQETNTCTLSVSS